MTNNIFDILNCPKKNARSIVTDATERYITAAMYLLFLKHNRSLDEIENIYFRTHEVQDSIGLHFAWGINTAISEFVKNIGLSKHND